jgi:hypothetical protein
MPPYQFVRSTGDESDTHKANAILTELADLGVSSASLNRQHFRELAIAAFNLNSLV